MAIQGLGSPRRRMSMDVKVAAPSVQGTRKVASAKSSMFNNIAGLAAQLEERRYKAESDSQYNDAKDSLVREEHALAKNLDLKYQGKDRGDATEGYEKDYSDGLVAIKDSLSKNLNNNTAYDKFNTTYDSYTTRTSIKRQDETSISKALFYDAKIKDNKKKNLATIAESGDPELAATLYASGVEALKNDNMNMHSEKGAAEIKASLGDYGYEAVMANVLKGGKAVDAAEELMKGNNKNPAINDMIKAMSAKQIRSANKSIASAKESNATSGAKRLKDYAKDVADIYDGGKTVSDEQLTGLFNAIDANPKFDQFEKDNMKNDIVIAKKRAQVNKMMVTEDPKKWTDLIGPPPKNSTTKQAAAYLQNKKNLNKDLRAGAVELLQHPVNFRSKHDPTFAALAGAAHESAGNYGDFKAVFKNWADSIGQPYMTPLTDGIKADFKNIEGLVEQGSSDAAFDKMREMVKTLGPDAYVLAKRSGIPEEIIAATEAGDNSSKVIRLLSTKITSPWTEAEGKAMYKKIRKDDQYKAIAGNGTPTEVAKADAWANIVYKQMMVYQAQGAIGFFATEAGTISTAFKLHSDSNTAIETNRKSMIIPNKYAPEKVKAFIKYHTEDINESSYKKLDIGEFKDLSIADHINSLRKNAVWRRTVRDTLELHSWNDETKAFDSVLNSKGLPIEKSLSEIAKEPMRTSGIELNYYETQGDI